MREMSAVRLLARFRVFLGFVCGAVVLWLAEPTAWTVAAGACVGGVGEAIRIWAAGHLRKSREVTASGPYRWFSHPLYLGSSVMGIGLAIASGKIVVVLLIACYLAVALTVAARSEEAFLRRTFGDEYERYREGTVDGMRRFSWSLAMANHESRAIIGFLLAVGLLALKAARNV
jgi:protein-S-isoprenylcysteine O-methyltransferase Ste14